MECFKIGILGSVDSGKYTFVDVLKTNKYDDGRGLLRKYVMKHNHELESGRTSCISYNNVMINNKLFNLVDLAGHESYLKTTIYGLNALHLNHVIIIIGANMGINKITEEHYNLARVLNLSIIFVVNKIDLCPDNILNNTLNDLNKLTKNNLNIILNNDVNENIVQLEMYNKIMNNNDLSNNTMNNNDLSNNSNKYPLFFISNKTGYGIDNVRSYLSNLHDDFVSNLHSEDSKNNINNKTNNDSIYIIQETYTIKGIGIVFYGYQKSGCIKKNDVLKIGPFGNQFYNISVRNIRNVVETDVDVLKAGELGCLAIKQLNKDFNFKREHIKKGMYITNNPFCCHEFIAKIYILHHPTTIRENYQSTIHCGSVIQAAKITEIINIKKNVASDNKLLRTGDQAKVRFQFLFKPEFIENESMFIFRENNAKGVGKIINTINN